MVPCIGLPAFWHQTGKSLPEGCFCQGGEPTPWIAMGLLCFGSSKEADVKKHVGSHDSPSVALSWPWCLRITRRTSSLCALRQASITSRGSPSQASVEFSMSVTTVVVEVGVSRGRRVGGSQRVEGSHCQLQLQVWRRDSVESCDTLSVTTAYCVVCKQTGSGWRMC